ncbi:MAG: SurA N-terminal domain-containing protein, partial [Clostridiales bacterium]|nr:SurA N-terminal domain-containing protein [Clostridiales bacterium]
MKKNISLLLALTLFLCGSYARAEDRAVASVNGVPIWESELLRRMTVSAVLNQQSGDEITNEERTARDTVLRIQVLDALIEERVLLNEAEKRGLTADFLREDIDTRFRKMIGAVAAYVLASYPGLEGEALLEQVESLLKATGSSLDSYYETAR